MQTYKQKLHEAHLDLCELRHASQMVLDGLSQGVPLDELRRNAENLERVIHIPQSHWTRKDEKIPKDARLDQEPKE